MVRFSFMTFCLMFPFSILGFEWSYQNPVPFGCELNDVSFIDSSTIVVASGDKIIRSQDAGKSWHTWNWSFSPKGITAIHFTSRDSGWIISTSTVYNSWDQGKHWTKKSPPLLHCKAAFWENSQKGYVIGSMPDSSYTACIFRTNDAGSTWDKLYSTRVFNITINSIYFPSKAIGYVSGDYGILYSSTDTGKTWLEGTYGPLNNPSTLYENPKMVFFNDSTGLITLSASIYRTTDYGKTWQNIYNSEFRDFHYDIGKINSSDALIVGMTNVGTDYSGYLLLSSFDKGANWTQSTVPSDNFTYFSALDCIEDNAWIVGSRGMMVSTGDGINFIIKTQGMTRDLNALCFADNRHGWVVGDNGAFLSTSDGSSWQNGQLPFNKNANVLSFIDSATGWVGGDAGQIAYTKDGGKTWMDRSLGIGNDVVDIQFVNNDYGWVLVDGYILYHTVNGGALWERQTVPTPPYFGNLKAFFFTDKNTGYIAGGEGKIYGTRDGGSNWVALPHANNRDSIFFNDVFFLDKNYGYAIGSYKVYRTTDAGQTWESMYSKMYFGMHHVFFSDKKHGCITGASGTIYTSDSGHTWRQEKIAGNGVFFTDSTTGWVCSWGGQIYKTNYSPATDIKIPLKKDNSAVHKFIISGYKRTIIITPLAEATQNMRIKVFGLDGRLVKAEEHYTGKGSIALGIKDAGLFVVGIYSDQKVLHTEAIFVY